MFIGKPELEGESPKDEPIKGSVPCSYLMANGPILGAHFRAIQGVQSLCDK